MGYWNVTELLYIFINISLAGLPLAATIVLGLLRRREKKSRDASWAKLKDSALLFWIVIQSVIDAAVIGIVTYVAVALMWNWQYRICFILIAVLVELLAVGFMTQWFTWKRFLIWGGCLTVAIGLLIGVGVYNNHLEKITLPEYFDFHTFIPFQEDSLVKHADEEATLRFKDGDDLPRMDGATALYPVYAAFAQATYPDSLAQKEWWEIEELVDCTTTGYAYQRIVDGECDIIFVGGPSKDQEAYAASKGVTLEYIPIGREAFVFFVNPANPIDGLTLDQIRDIYSGKLTKWNELGVRGLGKIMPFQREAGSGSQTAMERFVMKDTPLMTPDKEKVSDGMGGILEQVSSYRNHRGAIGYSFRFYTTELMRSFDVKLLKVNGVAPTLENIENGSYALASTFFAVVRSDASDNTRALVEWICGPQGQALVRKTGYSPLGN
ncbi:MAG: substrate-binding domain-containing protein [Clostridia bacterium]|nr:substrate-binding domain-containing protein [Clostridia bacterium]